MPIYEYACNKCGTFEYSQRITEEPLANCPQCGGAVTRLISRTSFVLKGTGWYLTDYARNGAKSESSKEAKSESSEHGVKEFSSSSASAGSSSKSSDRSSSSRASSGAEASP